MLVSYRLKVERNFTFNHLQPPSTRTAKNARLKAANLQPEKEPSTYNALKIKALKARLKG